ncbi:MAG TPA: dicarboxylate/amino acid:cation symporter [Vicinamibacterales bacterium]|nr:dicarboxylate/amino acid:cation symporter [Vicinamibacterales bacterium]
MKTLKSLYVQVLIGIALGVLVGVLWPERGAAMKPLGDGFIKLIRMLIGPLIFATIVAGIGHMRAGKDVGRIGLRALVYFEVMSTLALAIGLVVVNVLKPGSGVALAAPSSKTAAEYASTAGPQTTVDFILNIIPNTFVDAFARGEILQVLLVAVLFGLALLWLGERATPLVTLIDQFGHVLFGMVNIVMRLAPLGAFGAMAFTIGQYGVSTLVSLGKLMAAVYVTCLLFVFVVLGLVLWFIGLNVLRFLRYIAEEILLVLGTSSSESALPRLMLKLERLGCSEAVVGLVVPTGYSFNLDGTSIYLTMGAIFVAQVSGIDLSLTQQVSILAILLLTSKGAAGVTGSGFVTLAATLTAIPAIPATGLALLVGVDRFMSEARSITNLIGNAVATVVIARWDGALDIDRARAELRTTNGRATEAPRHRENLV